MRQNRIFRKQTVSYVIAFIVILFFAHVSFISCKKDTDPPRGGAGGGGSSVNITNAQNVQNALVIDQSSIVAGNLPTPTSGNNDLSASITSIKVNSGGSVILPIIYQGTASVKRVYLQVIGAKDYFSITPVVMKSVDNYYVTINIPKNIGDGDFDIQYMVEDASNSLSNIDTTKIVVTNEVVDCTNAFNEGSDGLTFSTVAIGSQSGDVSIYYDTYTVPDRIDIYQGKTWITGTGNDPQSPIPPLCQCDSIVSGDGSGFIGATGTLDFKFDASKGQTITVVVSGCLNGGTLWEWELRKAPGCN